VTSSLNFAALEITTVNVDPVTLTGKGSGAVGSLLCNVGNLLGGLGGMIPGVRGIVNALNNQI
jgi:hypothetical protein